MMLVVRGVACRFAVYVGSTLLLSSTALSAQDAQPPPEVHEHVAVDAPLLTPTRDASGTGWLPDATPMYGVHREWNGWEVRLNGAIFGNAVFEPGDRHRTGGSQARQVASTNWGMIMARRSVAGGRFGVRAMFSAEPWTVSRCGSLNFLAVGEVCGSDTVHDRQQPHDLLMELAVDYERRLRGQWRWQLYAGVAGEPALGPPGYPHRPSAIANPNGPVTHHWLDSTHVTFGVITGGVRNQRWKMEASMFNGREPDESRVDVDLGRFDSVSARASFLPTDRWALQISAARLRVAASDFPFPNQPSDGRLTMSAIYHRPFGVNGIWATTAAFGATHSEERVALGVFHGTSGAGLVESSATFSQRNTFFGRGELGGMPAHHLHAHEYSLQIVSIGKIQAGYVRQLKAIRSLVPGVGAAAALNFVSKELAPRYSGRVAPGFTVFFTLQAARHQM